MNTLIHPNAPPDDMPVKQGLSAAMARLARFAERDIPGLAELLAACHSTEASNRARAIAAMCSDEATDPAALRASIGAVIDDLQSLPWPVEVRTPEQLKTQAVETLDAAVLYYGGRIDGFARALNRAAC